MQLEKFPSMFFKCSADGAWKMEYVSAGSEELTGYSPAELMEDRAISYRELIHPEDLGDVWAIIEGDIKNDLPYQVSYRIRSRTGEEKLVWEQGRGVYDAQNTLQSVEGFISHLESGFAPQTIKQDALNEVIVASSRAQDLGSLLEGTLKHCLEIFKLTSGMIWVGNYFEALGLPRTQAHDAQRRLQTLVIEDRKFRTVHDWLDEDSLNTLAPLSDTFDKLSVRASLIVPIRVEGKNIGGICLNNADLRQWTIEEISLAEAISSQLSGAAGRLDLLETIQEQAHLLQRILDTVQEGIFTLDVHNRILVVNRPAREFLNQLAGVGRGEILKQLGESSLRDILTPREDGLPHEVRSAGDDGRTFEVYPSPVIDVGEEKGNTILLRDVTEVRQAQHRVQEQIRRAAVGQLAAGIAHDFNNIVAAIILYGEMVLAMPELPNKGRKRMIMIIEQAQRAAALTRQILDFSRRGIMEPHPMELMPFLQEIVNLLKRTLPENIQVTLNHGEDDYVVSSDPARLQQVFMNLAVNARDAMPSGGELLFDISLVEFDSTINFSHDEIPDGKWVRIDITDTGRGIHADDLAHVFEPFFTTKLPGEGSGLGLAQVFGIVSQHEGYIEVNSELGEGTTFSVYFRSLPVAMLSGIIPEISEPAKGQMETILVVEDDLAMREALSEMLEMMNYQVLSANNGKAALDIFAEKPSIDLVLSDLVMPEMGGVALHSELKKKYPDTKMVVMTGYPLVEGGKDLLEQGIVAWLQKPLDADTLARTIREVLSMSK